LSRFILAAATSTLHSTINDDEVKEYDPKSIPPQLLPVWLIVQI